MHILILDRTTGRLLLNLLVEEKITSIKVRRSILWVSFIVKIMGIYCNLIERFIFFLLFEECGSG